MDLRGLLGRDRVGVVFEAGGPEGVFRAVAERAAGVIEGRSAAEIRRLLEERESRQPTVTPDGVAFPHAMMEGLAEPVLVSLLLRPPVSFSVEGVLAVDVVFGIVGSVGRPFQHVQLLSRLARLVRGEGALDRIRTAADDEGLLAVLRAEDASVA